MPTALTEGDMLLEAVLDSPEDDAPRLILADWLQEHGGEPEKARVIRSGMELHRLAEEEGWRRLPAAEWYAMRRARKWEVADADLVPALCPTLNLLMLRPTGNVWRLREGYDFALPRGMLGMICLPMQDLLDHAAAIFSRHPVEEVVLTDKEPLRESRGDGHRWWWSHSGDAAVGRPNVLVWGIQRLFDYEGRVGGWGCEEDALAALSRACVQYGRQRRIRRGVGVHAQR